MKNDAIIAGCRYSAEHISLYHWLEKTEHVEKRIEAVDLTTFQGSSNLRNALGTFRTGEFVVLAGRPGMGKRTLLLNIALNITQQANVAFLTLDLTEEHLADHIVSSVTEIPYKDIRSGNLPKGHHEKLVGIKNPLLKNIYLYYEGASTLEDIWSRCTQVVLETGCTYIVIDSLQLLWALKASNAKKGSDSRTANLNTICLMLKRFTREYDATVIISSHTKRTVELRPANARRPVLADIGEDCVEQLADKILFLYRPAYYGLPDDESGNKVDNIAEVIMRKNCFGALGTAMLTYHPEISKFKDYIPSHRAT